MRELLALWYALAALVGWLSPLTARYEFVAQARERRVTGAEICFFRGFDEATPPLERIGGSGEVRCFSADQVIDVPAGQWAYYARHASGLIGTNPAVITNPLGDGGEHLFQRSIEELQDAAFLDTGALRRDDATVAVYASNAGTDLLPLLYPLHERVAIVPANMPLHLLRIQDGRVTSVSAALTLKSKERRNAPPFASNAVVAWVEFSDSERQPGAHWKQMPAPEIVLRSGKETRQPEIAPRAGFGTDGSLLVFRDVPRGAWQLDLAGDLWRRARVAIDVQPGLTIASDGLVTAPAGAVDVQWQVASAPLREERCVGDEERQERQTTVRVLSCAGLQPGIDASLIDVDSCRNAARVAKVALDDTRARIGGVPAGTHLVELQHPGFAPRRGVVTIERARSAHVPLTLESFNVFGRVTMDGKPLRAQLDFATGNAVSGDDGSYYATLAESPRQLAVHVRNCTDGATLHMHVPEQPIPPNQPYDIDVRRNVVKVTVLDAESGRPIPKATVQIASARAGGEHSFHPQVVPTDEDGRMELWNVPPQQDTVVCALAEQYERKCEAPIRLLARREATATVRLDRQRFAGRILAPGPIVRGQLWFVAPTGVVTEHVTVGEQGRFQHRHAHAPPEHAVFASNQPLAVLPLSEAQPLELRVPQARVRSLEVTSANQNHARIGLFLGGRYVPGPAFDHHQSLRGLQWFVIGRGPLHIPHILETAPITIVLGDPPRGGPDPFTQPGYTASRPARAVADETRIVF